MSVDAHIYNGLLSENPSKIAENNPFHSANAYPFSGVEPLHISFIKLVNEFL